MKTKFPFQAVINGYLVTVDKIRRDKYSIMPVLCKCCGQQLREK